MDVLFVRHAQAETATGEQSDEDRALTEQGAADAAALARALQAMGIKLAAVLSSPLLRAVQTAGPLAKAYGLKMKMADFMAPPGQQDQMRTTLEKLDARHLDTVALVGHAPSIDEMVTGLVAGGANFVSLSKPGVACVRLTSSPDEAELRWLMRREQIQLLGPNAKKKKR